MLRVRPSQEAGEQGVAGKNAGEHQPAAPATPFAAPALPRHASGSRLAGDTARKVARRRRPPGVAAGRRARCRRRLRAAGTGRRWRRRWLGARLASAQLRCRIGSARRVLHGLGAARTHAALQVLHQFARGPRHPWSACRVVPRVQCRLEPRSDEERVIMGMGSRSNAQAGGSPALLPAFPLVGRPPSIRTPIASIHGAWRGPWGPLLPKNDPVASPGCAAGMACALSASVQRVCLTTSGDRCPGCSSAAAAAASATTAAHAARRSPSLTLAPPYLCAGMRMLPARGKAEAGIPRQLCPPAACMSSSSPPHAAAATDPQRTALLPRSASPSAPSRAACAGTATRSTTPRTAGGERHR